MICGFPSVKWPLTFKLKTQKEASHICLRKDIAKPFSKVLRDLPVSIFPSCAAGPSGITLFTCRNSSGFLSAWQGPSLHRQCWGVSSSRGALFYCCKRSCSWRLLSWGLLPRPLRNSPVHSGRVPRGMRGLCFLWVCSWGHSCVPSTWNRVWQVIVIGIH